LIDDDAPSFEDGFIALDAMLGPTRDAEILRLRGDRDRFVAFAFAAAELLLEVSSEGKIVYAAGAINSLTGISAAELLGRQFIALTVPEDRAQASAALSRLRRFGRIDPVALRFRGADSVVSAVLNGQRLPGGHTNPNHHLAITTVRASHPAMGSDAHRDAETGVLDFEGFAETSKVVLRDARERGLDTELGLIEIPHLRSLKGSSNANATGTFLAEMGSFLKARSINGDLAGRLSDSRYGVVLAKTGKTDQLKALGEDLSQHFQDLGLPAKDASIVTRSLDLAAGPLSNADAHRALVFALGRFAECGTENFAPDTLAFAFRNLVEVTVERITSLKSTVVQGQIEFAFQPIVDLKNRQTHHYEMLARIRDTQTPLDTVQFAEATGLIEDFDLLVCRRALDQIAKHRDPNLRLAVNLSGRSLESDIFVNVLMKLLEPLGADRHRLLFELTETSRINDLAKAEKVLSELRQRGHRICLDDFGAGAASLVYIQSFTVDFLKIDGAYVRGVNSSARDHAILKAIASMARDLGISTIAEMVENDQQLAVLSALGVDLAQGYLFGKPGGLPHHKLVRAMRAGNSGTGLVWQEPSSGS
jgi:PAS domain S-box-containing protein